MADNNILTSSSHVLAIGDLEIDLHSSDGSITCTREGKRSYDLTTEGGGSGQSYTAGTGIEISTDRVISIDDDTVATKTYVAGELEKKQDVLTPGENITISGSTISATDTKYSAGTNISIDSNNVISATIPDTYATKEYVDEKDTALQDDILDEVEDREEADTALSNRIDGKQDTLTAGDNITIENNVISATDTKYTAGTGINITGTVISATTPTDVYTKEESDAKYQEKLTAGTNITIDENNVISATGSVATQWGNITGTLSDQTDLSEALSGKQDTLTAGTGITISEDNTISATTPTDVYTKTEADSKFQDKLTAGDNITIENGTISATDTKYTAGDNISISNTNVISASVPDTYATKDYVDTEVGKKQDTLTAGDNIQITNGTISTTSTISATEFDAMNNGTVKVGYATWVPNGVTITPTSIKLNDGSSDVISADSSDITLTYNGTTYSIKDGLTKYNEVDQRIIALNEKESSDIAGAWQGINTKQDILTAGDNITITGTTISATDTTYSAGDNITIDTDNKISATIPDTVATKDYVDTEVGKKQDTLTAGDNITIVNNTISATDTTYTAGENIAISEDHVISATGCTGVALIPGDGITMTEGESGITISSTASGGGAWGEITGDISNQTDLQTELDSKQDTMSAGDGITITDNTISLTNNTPIVPLIAGDNIAMSETTDGVVISASGVLTGVAWGQITGTLSNQSDLNTALSGKQDTLTFATNSQVEALFA